MMVICAGCGMVFDDSESAHVSEYHSEVDASEHFAACPHCGCTESEEAEYCTECGELFTKDELNWGNICDDCLKKAADAETFLRYALDDRVPPTQVATLEDFVFTMFFGISDLSCSSAEFKEHCLAIYNENKNAADFKDKILMYLEDTNTLRNEFAEWLADQKKESRHD